MSCPAETRFVPRPRWFTSGLSWFVSTLVHASLLLALTRYWTFEPPLAVIVSPGSATFTVVAIAPADEDDPGGGEDQNPTALDAGQTPTAKVEPRQAGARLPEPQNAAPPEPETGPSRRKTPDDSELLASLFRRPTPSPQQKAPELSKTDGSRVRPASAQINRAVEPFAEGGGEPPYASRSGSLGPIGNGMARTEVFGAVGQGRKFVYVFDRSGSMDGHKGAPLSAAKRELLASLTDLGQTQQFQIIFYNEHPRVFSPTGSPGRLVFATDQNKNLAQKFVGSITADGGTEHEEALELALKMAPDVVFFLTDADEPRMSEKQLARVRRLNRGATINTVEFGYGAQRSAENFLVELARGNGGKHVYVDVSKLKRSR